nr:hypothetical protein Itr_chr08CG12490 [Ipomoea trifida]
MAQCRSTLLLRKFRACASRRPALPFCEHEGPLQMIAQNLTMMELKNFLEEFIRGLSAETPPIVPAFGALCTRLRHSDPGRVDVLGRVAREIDGLNSRDSSNPLT